MAEESAHGTGTLVSGERLYFTLSLHVGRPTGAAPAPSLIAGEAEELTDGGEGRGGCPFVK